MSVNFNDVPCSDLKETKQTVSFLGDIDCNKIYMDLYDGIVLRNDLTAQVPLYELT